MNNDRQATDNSADRVTLPRRRFLQLVGAGTAATGLSTLPGAAALADTGAEVVGSAAHSSWSHVKAQWMIDPTITFMNVGTMGPSPRPIVRRLDQLHREVATVPLSGYGSYDAQRAALAADFGCQRQEFAISGNTTDGLCKIMAGLRWEEGDEIVSTNHEHSAGESAMAIAAQRHGAVIKRIPLPSGNDQRAEDYVELFTEQITPRTKAFLFSSPTFLTGTVLPIRLLAELAQQHGIISIVDGAHLPGMIDLDFHRLGMDFFAGPGAKWQCAPSGCGILYVRNRVSEHNPLPLPEFWPTISMGFHGVAGSFPDDRGDVDVGGVLTNIGNQQRAIFDALVATAEFWNGIGRANIEARVRQLSLRLKEQIVERWGVESLYSPKDDERLLSGLTTFNPFLDPSDIMDGSRASEFVGRLEDEYRYVIRFTTTPVIGFDVAHRPMRISTHLFHDEDDVDGIVAAMWDLAQKMA